MAVTINGSTGITSVNGSAAAPSVTGTDTDTGIVYGTNTLSLATGGTTAVTVDSSQNVGIGTSSPSYKLHVVKGANDNAVVLDNGGGAGDNTSPYLSFAGTNGGSNYIRGRIRGAYASATAGGLVFDTGDSGSMSERARIDSSGNLLVGSTSTFISSGVSFCVGTTSGGMQLGGNGTQGYCGAIYPSSRGIEHINTASAGSPKPYYFTTQGGAAYTSLNASAFNVNSDYRLKENIQPLTGALNRLSLLKPSRFNYKTDIETKMPFGENTVDGFLAHEVSVAVPEAVSGEKDALHDDGKINPQSLDTSKLIPLLTAAIQELNAKVDAQAAEIAALKAA